jgi:CBS domain containing-hemolysin-like protein
MTPRVELVAIDAENSLAELLVITRETKYSRVPVYNQTVDEIVGVVLSRELLEFADIPDVGSWSPIRSVFMQYHVRLCARQSARAAHTCISYIADLGVTNVSTIMEDIDFVPESMSVMNALKQMRRQVISSPHTPVISQRAQQ